MNTSDVQSITQRGSGSPSADDHVQISGLPTPLCWIRGLVVSYAHSDAASMGVRLDFVTTSSAGAPTENQILFSIPCNGRQSGMSTFMLPEDFYIKVTDGDLYVTSGSDVVLSNYSITLFYQ